MEPGIAPRGLSAALVGLDERIVAAMNAQPLAGLAVGVVTRDALVYTRGFGLADLDAGPPVSPETVFRIGSISKTLTALALLQLWEQGKVDLDAPVNDYLRAYRVEPAPGAPVPTLRHLLTHTGGIGELRSAADLLRPMIGLGAKPPAPPPAAYYAGGLRAELPPGTKWAYANHAYATLGQVVEDVSGEPFAEYMQRHVFAPLGMAHSDYLRSERVRDALAQGYAFHRGKLRPVDYLDIAVSGAGAAFSSLDDMALYVGALLRGGQGLHGAVVQPATLAAMLTPQYQLDPRLPAMGLAFMLEQFDGHRVAGHDGGWAGFVSSLLVAPDDGVGVLAFSNTSSPAPSTIAHAMLCYLLGLPEPAARLPRRGVPERPDLWPELAGAYGPPPGLNTNARIWAGFGGEIEIGVRGNHLALRALVGPLWQGVRLYPVDAADPLAFEALHEGQAVGVIFQRDAAGRVDRLLLGLNAFHKRAPLRSLRGRAAAAAGGLGGLALAAAAWRKWGHRT